MIQHNLFIQGSNKNYIKVVSILYMNELINKVPRQVLLWVVESPLLMMHLLVEWPTKSVGSGSRGSEDHRLPR